MIMKTPYLNDTMYNGNITTLKREANWLKTQQESKIMKQNKKMEAYINIENNNFSSSNRVFTHVQEQYIPLQV